jgi:hypothetical protein
VSLILGDIYKNVVLVSIFCMDNFFYCLDGNEQSGTDWKGFFSISSYSPFFNVDTDVVVDRMISSVFPRSNFFTKIDANPDL